ncbi:MAG TPA: blaR1 peptidase M56 family protein, partial [Flavobacteriaceae bacterium]|nr:blaR1 peptidase M56 family protein [Flavobacteriaceae bacterium]
SKGELTQEEKGALAELIYNHYPDGVGGITGEKGEIHLDKDRNHFKNEYDNDSEVPFAVIEKVPTYPGCFGTNEEMKACMSKQIQQFVGENFNTKLANQVNLSGRQRISVQFKI